MALMYLPHGGGFAAHGQPFRLGFDNDGIGRLSQNVTTVAGHLRRVRLGGADGRDRQRGQHPAGRNQHAGGVHDGAAGVWARSRQLHGGGAASERLDLLFRDGERDGTIAFDDVTVTLNWWRRGGATCCPR